MTATARGTKAAAQSSAIDAVEQHAWSENAGWVDFDVTHGEATVYPLYLTGFAWAENLGWVSFRGTTTGVPTAYWVKTAVPVPVTRRSQ